MKFGEEFDETLVSAWRDKYIDYKSGKRLVKAIQRAVNRINGVSDPRGFLLSPFSFQRKDGRHGARHHEMEEITPLRVSAAELAGADGDFTMGLNPTLSERGRQAESLTSPAVGEDRADTTPFFEDGPRAIERSAVQQRDAARAPLIPIVIPSGPARLSSGLNDRALDTPKPGRLRRFPTGFSVSRVATQTIAIQMHPIDVLKLRKREFIDFMDSELEKIEAFYRQKEEEAGKRLQALRQQLCVMREQRNEELESRRFSLVPHSSLKANGDDKQKDMGVHVAYRLVRGNLDTRSLQAHPYAPVASDMSSNMTSREYVRKAVVARKVPYRTAKAKLRIVTHELFRGLEFLKAYALLNRTAFRKLNKKFDKATDPAAKPKLQWFDAKVDSSYFVTSNLVDEYINDVESLYAQYLERGNHKLAVEKLRQLTKPKGDKSASALLNGLMVGVGITFAVEGIWLGIRHLSGEDDDVREQTAFLLRIYAGYFLMLYLFSWFCFNCRTWSNHKVNYPFIFEFDTRHDLDWRQLSNFPCFFTLLLGVVVWFNFMDLGFGKDLFLWWPVILIGLSVIIILLPLPLLRWRSRRWFAIAHWRLLLSGLYPVEFRDFFLGDMYCSLTYAIANAEIFFCLYVNQWDKPSRCGSKGSWLVGFFTAVPPLWRALQCMRRFWDTKSAFPHLANFSKYGFAIAATVSLSLFRLDNSPLKLSLFITFASISAFYSALWDIFMDFSLMQGGPLPGLREILAFDKPWLYYGIMIIDPILRFGWILTLLFVNDIQLGAYVAFIVAFLEVTRRGMWTLFRVENEHCTNVKIQKISRDVPLPYEILSDHKEANVDPSAGSFTLLSINSTAGHQSHLRPSTPLMETGGHQPKAGLLRSISRRLGQAHRQDFQRSTPILEEEESESPERRRGIQKALLDEEDSDHEIMDDARGDRNRSHSPVIRDRPSDEVEMSQTITTDSGREL